MATFRNVSGLSLDLMLPEWYAAETVAAGDTVEVDDDLVAPEGRYEFDQPGVWERVDGPPVAPPAPEPPAPPAAPEPAEPAQPETPASEPVQP